MNQTFNQVIQSPEPTLDRLPKVYLAGKIRKHCWRHGLISGLRNHSWDDGPLIGERFIYVGPFFVGCDHGCFHNENSHGAVGVRGVNVCPGRDPLADFDAPHHEITNLCLNAVSRSDLLFCYIDSADCFGTMVEIGYAIAHEVPVVIAIAPGVATTAANDFWFACVRASWIIYDAAVWELPEYLARSIRRYACP